MHESNNKYYLVKYLDEKYASHVQDGDIFFRCIEDYTNSKNWGDRAKERFTPDYHSGINYSNGEGLGFIDVLTLRHKIYCMSLLEYDDNKESFITPDKRMRMFGDVAVVIYDPEEFMRRVIYALIDRYNYCFWMSFQKVRYDVDLNVKQPYDPFCKNGIYSYQKEFRIAVDLALGKFHPSVLQNITDFALLTFPGKIEIDDMPDSLSDTMILNIGDIRDICICVSTESMVKGDFAFPESIREPGLLPALCIPKAMYPTFFKYIKSLP